jgi:NAD(P)-dependent dehydrogenase (short-subunit alcohol dehydrogenase family)
MDLGLKGKRAIVTGGSKGIGRAIVEALVADGAAVAFCARTAADVTQAEADLRARGATAYGASLDVRDAERFVGWMGEAIGRLGGLDILVSNVTTRVHARGEAMWRECFEVDFLQHVRAIEAGLPALAASGAGSVVVISSIAAVMTQLPPGEEGYGAMKAALINHVGQLAATQARKGVRVNAVSPGPVHFPGGFWDQVKTADPAFFERAGKVSALGRHATAEEVAAVAVFLASPAASYVSGANWRVDGGAVKATNF